MIILTVVLSLSLAANDMIRTGNDVVVDRSTGLEWQDSNITAEDTRTWEEALAYCETLVLDGKDDWRLPNKNELLTIVDYTREDPASSPVFQHTVSEAYWSSTSIKSYYDYAWVIFFYNGYSYANFKAESDNLYVRCVRETE
jgi:hypothetical protein